MIALRTLVLGIVVLLMSGCGTLDKIRSDVAAAKVYLRGNLAPGQCRAPGEEDGSKSCYYYLEMMDPQVPNMFSARIAPEVFTASLEDCKKTMADILEEYEALKRKCPTDIVLYPDKDTVYTFAVQGDTAGLSRNQKVNLESIPGTKALRKSVRTFEQYLDNQRTRMSRSAEK
jgi:hypothetical protein